MKLIYSKEKNNFRCLSTYEERHIPKEAGFRWSPENKYWWTAQVDTALKLIQYADEECKMVIENILRKREERKNLSSQISIQEDFKHPSGLDYLPYQKVGIKYLLKTKNVFLADEMGLGKTIQVIGLINNDETLKKILIVCPALLKLNWAKELRKWLVRDLSIFVVDSKNGKQEIKEKNIIIINYDILSKYEEILKQENWDIVIFDESHYLKNIKAQRTKSAFTIIENIPRRICLTGTPILNRPAELFTQLQILKNPLARNWKWFVQRYANATLTRWGWDVSGATNLDELNEKLRETCMIRRLKKDVLTELPEKRRQIIEIEATGEWLNNIKKEKNLIKSLIKEKDLENLTEEELEELYIETINNLKANTPEFESIAQLRHYNALMKTDFVIQFAKEILENEQKIVIFAHHRDVIEKIEEGLKEFGVVSVLGGEDDDKRNEKIKQFQEGDIRVFIGSIKACGVGITLTNAATCIFAETTWTPADLTQAEDRLHRIGQKDCVIIYHIVANGSIDAYLVKSCLKKQEIIEKTLNQKQ